MSKIFHPECVREYDIRGVYGHSLTENDAYLLGRKFPYFCKAKNTVVKSPLICVAQDGRLSSPALANALFQGLKESGAHVIDVGVGPTPMLYYGVKYFNAQGGIMVTGSHNPSNENGFKMLLQERPFWGDDLRQMALMPFPKDDLPLGTLESYALLTEYVHYLLQQVKTPFKGLRVAWDPGNGATGTAVEELVKKLPGSHFIINSTIDGTFPAHHPDPSIEDNMQQLSELVQKNSCDIGIAFDGDGDRLGVTDSKGRVLWGDQFGILLAQQILDQHPDALILGDVKSSQRFFQEIQNRGGQVQMVRTGHSPIKMKMQETGALLGVEVSGHVFYQNNYGFDDGLYASIQLLNYLQDQPFNLAQFIERLPNTYTTPELRLPCEENQKQPLMEQLVILAQQHGLTFNTIDGIRVSLEKGWWLVRASNTQSLVVVRAEGKDHASLNETIAHLQYFLEKISLPWQIDLKKILQT